MLLQEFREMEKSPYFEVMIDGQIELFEIKADGDGLFVLTDYDTILVGWDEIYSLDEHLELVYQQLIEEYNKHGHTMETL